MKSTTLATGIISSEDDGVLLDVATLPGDGSALPENDTNVSAYLKNAATGEQNDTTRADLLFSNDSLVKKIHTAISEKFGPPPNSDSFLVLIPPGFGIDLQQFRDQPPRSPLNPEGDLKTTEEFSRYAVTQYFVDGNPASDNIDDVYIRIIDSACSSTGNDEAVVKAIESAKEKYKAASFYSQFTRGYYRLSYPTPSNFYEEDCPKHHINLTTTLPDPKHFAFFCGGCGGHSVLLHEGSFDVTCVQINRPWMDTSLFKLDGWSCGTERHHQISNGFSKDPNGKLLPYISKTLILVSSVRILAGSDEMQLGTGAHVMGIIMSMIPSSPPVDGTTDDGPSISYNVYQ